MLEEYQNQSQHIQDNLQQAFDALETLRRTLFDSYPEEERTYRMGKAMTALGNVSTLLVSALGQMQGIEWPTEDQPR